MNILDIIIIIPIVAGFVIGLFKGLVKELLSLIAIVLGIYGAKTFEPMVTKLLLSIFDIQQKVAQPISYLILFVLIAIGLLILANMLDKLLSAISLGGLNKLLGGIFGGVKYALIVSVLLNIFNALDNRFSLIKEDIKKESITYYPMIKLAPELWKGAKDTFFDEEQEEEDNESL